MSVQRSSVQIRGVVKTAGRTAGVGSFSITDLSREQPGKIKRPLLRFLKCFSVMCSSVSLRFVSFCRGCWMDVWELMSQECRDEVVLIDSSCLLETLETYLRKHR